MLGEKTTVGTNNEKALVRLCAEDFGTRQRLSRVYTMQPVVKPVVQPGRFDNRLNEQWLFVQHGCHTGCQFDNRLYRVNGVLIYLK